MKYVDGFVVAVPAENKEAYIAMAAKQLRFSRSSVHCAWWSAGQMMSLTAN